MTEASQIAAPSSGAGSAPSLIATLLAPARQEAILRWTLAAFALGVALRLAVFVFAIYSPITNESGNPVSPALIQKGADFSFYQQSQQKYSRDLSGMLDTFSKSLDSDIIERKLKASSSDLYEFVFSGPVLPFLIKFFEYGPGNTIPLSIFSLFLGIIMCLIWIHYLTRLDIPVAWAFLFAAVPNAIWYQLNNSADHYLFFLFTLFFTVYFSGMPRTSRVAIGLLLAIMMCLTKPNALPILAFVLLDQWRFRSLRLTGPRTYLLLAVMLTLIVLSTVFYAGYFVAVLRSTLNFDFYGIPHMDYLTGLFPALPAVIDMPLSWLTLLGAKLLHFVGLRPSWGGTSDALVLVRAAPGLILLPGMIWVLYRGDRSVALLVLLFAIPPFIGPTQERYNLPIQPILFAYGALAYTAGFRALSDRFARSRARALPSNAEAGAGDASSGSSGQEAEDTARLKAS